MLKWITKAYHAIVAWFKVDESESETEQEYYDRNGW